MQNGWALLVKPFCYRLRKKDFQKMLPLRKLAILIPYLCEGKKNKKIKPDYNHKCLFGALHPITCNYLLGATKVYQKI